MLQRTQETREPSSQNASGTGVGESCVSGCVRWIKEWGGEEGGQNESRASQTRGPAASQLVLAFALL